MELVNKHPVLSIRNLNVWYGDKQILWDLSLEVQHQQVTALIGPSDSGKSTLVRCINRLNDFTSNFRFTGEILFNGQALYAPETDVAEVRRKIGMVFSKPMPFRRSIYENVAYGPRVSGVKRHAQLDGIVEECLRKVQLWDAVSQDLHALPNMLSNGQQQRLCIARALANSPEVLIFDEPCDLLDSAETAKVEAIFQRLKGDYTIIFVTHKRRQAARVSDVAGLLYCGELIEFGQTEQIFTNPKDKRTENYVTGRSESP